MAHASETDESPVREGHGRAGVGDTSEPNALSSHLIGGRYRLEKEISRGGMGVVYRALDTVAGRQVALKRMLRDGRLDVFHAMFCREYYTLALIRHPRIIAVDDFGIDEGDPFYTMELLDGHDVDKLTPIPWRVACGYLRDVATSLLRIHQRRLVHRDLSPRNVRCTSQGFCKLLDFGGLTGFGVAEQVVGTAAMMAPEQARGMPLDARTDLYSLGALAYYMLTGDLPRPARKLEQLEAAYAFAVVPPSAKAPAPGGSDAEMLPAELDELVLQLLSVDPRGRPASAVEVIERLASIAGLQEGGEALATEHYLSTPLVGRDRELAPLEQRLEELGTRVMGPLVVEGKAGMGVSSLLREYSLRAQIAGRFVLRTEGARGRGPYSVASDLVDQLLLRLPQTAVESLPEDFGVLLQAFPALRSHLPEGRAVHVPVLPPGTMRAQILATFVQWGLRLAACHTLPISIVIDDLQSVDEASASAFAALALQADGATLDVVFGLHGDDPAAAMAPVRTLLGNVRPIQLRPFSYEDTHTLLTSVFGGARHQDRLSSWLQGLTGGSPAHVVELLRDLVANGTIAHRDGVWVLPAELDVQGLPSSMDGVRLHRLRGLDANARELAEVMSLHERPLPIATCRRLLPGRSSEAVDAALRTLVAQQMLSGSGEAYTFSHGLWRSLIRRALANTDVQALHARLAEALAHEDVSDMQARMDAGFHLVRAGEEARGADLLRSAALELVGRYDDMIAAAPALEAALEVYRKQGRSPHELLELLMPLCFAGYYVDRRLAERHGAETIALGEAITGLSLARRLRPWVGRHLSLYVGLASGALRFMLTPGLGGVRGFKRTLTDLSTCVVFLAVKSVICLAPEETESLRRKLEPLTALGKSHAAYVSHGLALGLLYLAEGKAARAEQQMVQVLQALETPEKLVDFAMEALTSMRGGALYVLGAVQGFRDSDDALRTADALRALGHRVYDMAADQVCINYYVCRGDMAKAAYWRRQLDGHVLASGSAWQAEVWAPVSRILADIATDDVIGSKQTLAELNALAKEVPSLQRYEVGARLIYLLQTGRPEEALALFPKMFEGAKEYGFIGWVTSRGSLACAYNMLGRHAEAERVALDTLALLEPEDYRYAALNLRVELQLAWAESGLGRPADASARLEACIARHQDGGGHVTLGQLHALRTEIALSVGDGEAYRRHGRAMEEHFEATQHPALIARASRIRLRGQGGARQAFGGAAAEDSQLARWAAPLEAAAPAARAQVALSLLIESSGAQQGYLFMPTDAGHSLVASEGQEPSAELLEAVAESFARHVGDTVNKEAHTLATEAVVDVAKARDVTLVLHPVLRPLAGRLHLVALAALESKTPPLKHPNFQLSVLVSGYLDASARKAPDAKSASESAVTVVAR